MSESYSSTETLYLSDGRIVRWMATAEDGRQVVEPRLLFDDPDDEDDCYFGPPVIAKRIWRKPPAEKRDATIEELKQKIEASERALATINKQMFLAHKTHQELVDKLSVVPALKDLDAFLAGQMKWYVTDDYRGVHVRTGVETVSVDNEDTKLGEIPIEFVLAGDNIRTKLQWEIQGNEVYPFKSTKDARAKAVEIVNEHFESGDTYYLEAVAKSAPRLGMKVPAHIVARVLEKKRKSLRQEMGGAKRRYEEWIEKARAVGLDENGEAASVLPGSPEGAP